MGIRPSAETGSGDGNQLAVDQIGEVYANVKKVADNIDDVVLVSTMDPADLALVADNIATISSAVTAAANAAASASAAAASAAGADVSEANALTYQNSALASKNAAATSETNTLNYKNLAEGFKNSASASAIAAATSETNAAASATAAANSAAAAAGSATTASNANTAAQAAKVAAELAETNAELAETNAEAAQAAAVAAQLAAEAARDEAEAIAGGDVVTTPELNTALLDYAKLASANIFTANNTFNGGVNRFQSDPWGRSAIFGNVNAEAVADTSIVLSNTNYYNTMDFQSGMGDPNAVVSYGSLVSSASIGLFFNFDNGVSFRNKAGTTTWFSFTGAGAVSNVAITVPDLAYGAGWNGSLAVPTRNAVYDEIEALKTLVVGSVKYISTWNASTNTPAIPAAAAGNKGYYYKVSVAGATSIDGITDWKVGDWIISTGTAWEKVDNTDQVSTVNGQSGAVVLNTSHITESGNLYYTDARVRACALAGSFIIGGAGNEYQANLQFTHASNYNLMWGAAGANGRIYMNATGAVYRNDTKHLFRNGDGSVDWAEINSTGISTSGYIQGNEVEGKNLIIDDAAGTERNLFWFTAGAYVADIGLQADNVTLKHNVPTKHRFDVSGSQIVEIVAGGINATGAVTVNGASAGVTLGDRDLAGSISLYNFQDVFRVYINGADRFTVTATGDVACNDINATGTVVTPAITLNGTDLGATLNNKAQAYTTILSQSTSFTAGSSHNNAHIVLSGASRTMTLNNTAPTGTSFTTRFTTAWTITCTSLSKNGATPASGGSVAAGKSVTFLHEGGGTWIAWGDIT